MQRLFFALPLSNEDKAKIAKWRAELLALGVFDRRLKQVAPDNFHITLAFLGAVDETARDVLIEKAAEIKVAPFSLQFDHTEHFAKPKVAFLGTKAVPEPLQKLVKSLELDASDQGIKMHHSNYTPHITLFRKAREPLPKVVCDFHFEFTRFALFESCSTDKGVVYKELADWSLTEN